MTATGIITAVVHDASGADSMEPTLVLWWSFTKTVLAAAALRLVADGSLPLDGPVHGNIFTLHHLLQHRAELADYGQLAAYHEAVSDRTQPWSRDVLLRRLCADRLIFQPGRGWAYLNIGYLFVRELIERASGMELGAALDELVFSPLGIKDVSIVCEPAQLTATARRCAAA